MSDNYYEQLSNSQSKFNIIKKDGVETGLNIQINSSWF